MCTDPTKSWFAVDRSAEVIDIFLYLGVICTLLEALLFCFSFSIVNDTLV